MADIYIQGLDVPNGQLESPIVPNSYTNPPADQGSDFKSG